MEFDNEYRICFPDQKVFISRDHNWAFSAWEIARLRNYIKPGATLVHIDAHLDYLEPLSKIDQFSTENEAIDFGRSLGIAEFIIPARQTGTVDKLYMISNDSVDISEEVEIDRAYTLNHFEHTYKSKWLNETEGKSVILDLDLDFFNLNYEDWDCNSVLLPEPLIRRELRHIKDYMWEWDMVTVALSPEYCGGMDHCKYLYRLFLDVFELDIDKGLPW